MLAAMAVTAEELARLLNQMMVETQAQAARTTEAIAMKIVERMESGQGDRDRRSQSNYHRHFDKMERYGGRWISGRNGVTSSR